MTGETSAQVMHVMDGNLRAQDNGRKRHIAVDTIGLLLTVLITAAGIQDRDAAKPLLWNLRRAFPSIKLAWADGGYAGKLITWARTTLKPRLTLQIVKRPDDLHTFQVLPRRWVVERTLAWITRCRRTVRDYERLPAHHETIVYWAMTITMTRRLAAGHQLSRPAPSFQTVGGSWRREVPAKRGFAGLVRVVTGGRVWRWVCCPCAGRPVTGSRVAE